MKLLRKRDIPEEKYSNAFLGFGPEESSFVVELTYSMPRLYLLLNTQLFYNLMFLQLIYNSCLNVHLKTKYFTSIPGYFSLVCMLLEISVNAKLF